jgi:hypothetical protein
MGSLTALLVLATLSSVYNDGLPTTTYLKVNLEKCMPEDKTGSKFLFRLLISGWSYL